MNRSGSLASSLAELFRDRLALVRLRGQITRLKAQNYDLLAENVLGLRRALETQQRQVEELQRQLDDRDQQNLGLRAEYAALENRRSTEGSVSVRDERLMIFHSLQGILTQIPTMRVAIEEGADLRAQDLFDVLRPLDQLFRDLGFEQIGEAGKEIRFDPTRHKPVGRGAQSIGPDDCVRVRYVGYLFEGEIACKAEVTLVDKKESVQE